MIGECPPTSTATATVDATALTTTPPSTGAEPQLQFIKQKDEVLDQAPVYGFTIPVFGKASSTISVPLDERQQQVKLLVHSMNTKSLEGMVPKMIDEAEDYFRAWGDEGEVELRKVFSELSSS